MKVEISDSPKSQKKLAIELPYELFEKECDSECTKLIKRVKVPGFRPGKAPKDVVQKQHKHQIRANALEALVSNTIRDALVQNNINPISQPDVKDMVLEDDKPITFNIFVDVYPEFEVKNYTGFDFERTVLKVNEEDIENTIQKFLADHVEYKELSRKRAAKNTDKVIIDYEGKLDGVPFDGGKAEKAELILGSNQFIPGFEEQVEGMKIDDTKDINVTFPENYHSAELAGKEVVFTITLHDVLAKTEPELNDEFAKTLNPKAETVAKLKEMIAKDLQYEADQYVKFSTFTNILTKLVEENDFEVPTSVVLEQAGRMAQQSLQQYYQMGLNPEMFGISVESIRERFMDEAEVQIKRALTINKIADNQKFEVSDADIDAEIQKLVELTERSFDEMKKEINEKHIQSFKNDILSDKVYAFLCDNNKIKDVVKSRTEFEKEQQAEQESKAKETKKAKTTKAKAKKAEEE